MDAVSTSLVALLQRIISVQNQEFNVVAAEEFCTIVMKEVDGVSLASKLLAFWIQSTIESQALHTLTELVNCDFDYHPIIIDENYQLEHRIICDSCHYSYKWSNTICQLCGDWIDSPARIMIVFRRAGGLYLLDACMRRCGPLFISEVGKFRFLNEMIKLVSPKYLGNQTPKSVQEKVLNLLREWASSFPRETKFKEAYDMLIKQNVIKGDKSTPISNLEIFKHSMKRKNSIFEDEVRSKLLQKLLKSKNPEDLHAANRLIKTMVKEDEKRSQQNFRRIMDIESIHNNVKLLSDMLESYVATQSSKEDIELMKELYESCEHLQPTLERLAEETQNNEEILDIIDASEDLQKVRNEYIQKLRKNQPLPSLLSNVENQASLLDFSTPDITVATRIDASHSSKEYNISMNCQTDINLLKDIFENSNILQPFPALDIEPTTRSSSLLLPITVKGTTTTDETDKTLHRLNNFEEFLLNKTSADLEIHRTLQYGHENTSLVSIKNSLKQSDIKTISEVNCICDTDNSISQGNLSCQDELERTCSNIKRNNLKETNNSDLKLIQDEFKVESLVNIKIKLETITPGDIHPVTVIDERNGITVLLHFAKDSPRFDVSVIVITTMSKNHKPLYDYLFQAVVPQKCKCRLQLPSSTKLPAHNPFLPPSAITQIMLIANPYKEILSLKFMLSYSMDGETITEMGEVERLPIA